MTKLLSPILADYVTSLAFHCPGCDEVHAVNMHSDERPRWGYNNNPDKPTFTPSILLRTGRAVDPNWVREEGDPPEVCHSYVTDGQIQFLSDCTHGLAGQSVPIPEWPKREST